MDINKRINTFKDIENQKLCYSKLTETLLLLSINRLVKKQSIRFCRLHCSRMKNRWKRMNVVFEGRWKRNPEKNERKGEKRIKRTRSKFLAYSPFTATMNILVKFMFTFLIFCLFFIDLILVRDIQIHGSLYLFLSLKIHHSFKEHERFHIFDGRINITLLNGFLLRLCCMQKCFTCQRFDKQFGCFGH